MRDREDLIRVSIYLYHPFQNPPNCGLFNVFLLVNYPERERERERAGESERFGERERYLSEREREREFAIKK